MITQANLTIFLWWVDYVLTSFKSSLISIFDQKSYFLVWMLISMFLNPSCRSHLFNRKKWKIQFLLTKKLICSFLLLFKIYFSWIFKVLKNKFGLPCPPPWQPTPVFLPGESPWTGPWRDTVHRVVKSLTWLSYMLSTAKHRHFSGGSVTKTPRSQCRGPGFNPWSRN